MNYVNNNVVNDGCINLSLYFNRVYIIFVKEFL